MEETQCRVPRDGWHLYLIDNNDVESHDRLCRLAINLKTWLYTVGSHYTVRTNEYLVLYVYIYAAHLSFRFTNHLILVPGILPSNRKHHRAQQTSHLHS